MQCPTLFLASWTLLLTSETSLEQFLGSYSPSSQCSSSSGEFSEGSLLEPGVHSSAHTAGVELSDSRPTVSQQPRAPLPAPQKGTVRETLWRWKRARSLQHPLPHLSVWSLQEKSLASWGVERPRRPKRAFEGKAGTQRGKDWNGSTGEELPKQTPKLKSLGSFQK